MNVDNPFPPFENKDPLSTESAAESVAADDIFAGGGEMGALMRSIDWSQTPLGPVQSWPQSLRTALSICLDSRFPILIWWGPDLVMLYNDAYRPILGATKHPRSMGQTGRECWPEIWDLIGPMLEGVLTQGKATWSENQLLPLDRNGYVEECYFTFSYSPIRDETGGIGGVFTAVTETSSQVLGERRLRTLRELAARATDAQTDEGACRIATDTLAMNQADIPFALLYLLDKDGKHARLAGTSGLPPEAASSQLVIDLDAEVHEKGGQWPLAQVVHSGHSEFISDLTGLIDLVAILPDSARSALVLPIASSGQENLYGLLVVGINPHRALDDDYRGFFELVARQIAANIARIRAYQEEWERAEALEELDRAKTTFFSNVSHEFRTPLTLLLGPIEDALTDEEVALPPEQRERMEIVRRNALRLLKLVNTLLDFARIEAGRAAAIYEPTDLAAFTTELTNSFREAIERAGMELVVECEPLSEPVYVDREMWEKIALNLLSNAFKFTFEGRITVALHRVADHVELEVRDTGIGIQEEDLAHIFERFHRLRTARARTFEGSGIGLALVQELTRLHGGTVSVASEIGKGTTFTVSIPLGTAHLPADRINAARTLTSTALGAAPYVEEALRWLPGKSEDIAETATAWMEPHPLRLAVREEDHAPAEHERAAPASILLVDDNADMRDYLKRLLGQYWMVEAVADGLSALQAAKERTPDLILSDIMMPGLDGFQLLEALRTDPHTSSVPVMLLSARAGEEAALAGLAAGADDYLSKPFSARELLARVRARLEMAKLRASSALQARLHAQRLQQLAQASVAINSKLSQDEVLNLITFNARTIIGAHQAITSMNANHRAAQAVQAISLSEQYAAGQPHGQQLADQALSACVYSTNRPLRLTQAEIEAHPAWLESASSGAAEHTPMRGYLAAPLIRRDGRNLGLIQLFDKDDGSFTEEDEAILVQLAHMASIAIENAQLYQQAQEAVLARDHLLSMVSHDLKNPLGAIKGYTQLLQRRFARSNPLDVPDKERLDLSLNGIEATVGRMTALINELLDLAHLQAGKPIELALQSIDIVDLTRQVVTEQQQTSRQHKLHIEVPIEALRGNFDPVRIARALSNLLSNAIKYSPGTPDIYIRVTQEQDEHGAYAVITVRDEGIGIPARDLPYIFEQFRRADNVIGKIGGTGIGLASTRQIVEEHGGTINVRSKEGEGSTFTVRLPLRS
jgi:signal transduction histidine kinase/DNA-binding response OmpR family regulator